MLRIAICDDERIHRRHTAELIDSALAARSADISCFDSSEALLQAVVSGYAPDIAVRRGRGLRRWSSNGEAGVISSRQIRA